jgi:hypothetical protein
MAWTSLRRKSALKLCFSSAVSHLRLFYKRFAIHCRLALADNFYSSGIHSDEHDPRFKETFEDVYVGEHIADLPYYVIVRRGRALSLLKPAFPLGH